MRTEEEIIALVVGVAENDNRIRAVLLNGSRANPDVSKDLLQDYDIVFIVKEMTSFIQDKNWIDVLGERLIWQLPDEMVIGEKDPVAYHYLLLFEDHNRIDVTLFPIEKFRTTFRADSLTVCLLDKDALFTNLPAPNDADYHTKPPTAKLFVDCCNEFWWTATYVGKGLWRDEITYAKEIMEGPVRKMFLKMIEWYIGTQSAAFVSFGKGGRHMRHYLSPQLYRDVLATYPDSQIHNCWTALFLMADLFDELASAVAGAMGFLYNQQESDGATRHLRWVHTIQGKT